MADAAAVAVIERRPLVMRGICAVVEAHPDVFRLGTLASSGSDLFHAALDFPTGRSVVVLGQSDHPQPVAELQALVSSGHSVVMLDDRDHAATGLDPVIVYSVLAPADSLIGALRSAVSSAGSLQGRVEGSAARRSQRVVLTPREAAVLHLVALGRADKQIGVQLSIGQATVREYIKRIRRKYADAGRPAANRVELLRRAVEDGLIGRGDV